MSRIPKWDNAKAALIVCVLMGHLLDSYLKEATIYRSGFIFIYMFHMPGFFLISGLFSKRFADADQMDGHKVVPLLILCLIENFIRYCTKVVFGDASLTVFNLRGSSWFLFTLSACYVITYLVRKTDALYVMIVAIVAACIICYDKTLKGYFAVYRIANFFPFFYAGYLFDEEKIRKVLDQKHIRILSLVIIIVFAFICWQYPDIWKYKKLITGANHYYVMKLPVNVWTWIYKLAYFCISMVITMAVLSIIPSRRIPLATTVGKRTLTIFILHFAVLACINRIPWIESIALNDRHLPALLLFAAISILTALFLSIPLFSIPFQWILHPKRRKETSL